MARRNKNQETNITGIWKNFVLTLDFNLLTYRRSQMKIQILEKTPEPVDRDRALAHAQLTVRRDWAANIHGFNRWHQAELDPQPLVLHDLNGAELFYEFTLRRFGGNGNSWRKSARPRPR